MEKEKSGIMIKWGLSELELLKSKYLDILKKVEKEQEVTDLQYEMVGFFKSMNLQRDTSYNIVYFFDLLCEVIMEEVKLSEGGK
jgi:hypothetical protein